MLDNVFIPTDEQWREIKADQDPPSKYVSLALNIPKERVTPEQRASAKVVLFGTIYGQSRSKE